MELGEGGRFASFQLTQTTGCGLQLARGHVLVSSPETGDWRWYGNSSGLRSKVAETSIFPQDGAPHPTYDVLSTG